VYYKKNKARYLAHCRRRQAKILKARIGCQKAVAVVYERASELRKFFDVVVDHIVPLINGGSHSVENLQIIYAWENRRKGRNSNYKPRIIFT